jgi:hypothetical protein
MAVAHDNVLVFYVDLLKWCAFRTPSSDRRGSSSAAALLEQVNIIILVELSLVLLSLLLLLFCMVIVVCVRKFILSFVLTSILNGFV